MHALALMLICMKNLRKCFTKAHSAEERLKRVHFALSIQSYSIVFFSEVTPANNFFLYFTEFKTIKECFHKIITIFQEQFYPVFLQFVIKLSTCITSCNSVKGKQSISPPPPPPPPKNL